MRDEFSGMHGARRRGLFTMAMVALLGIGIPSAKAAPAENPSWRAAIEDNSFFIEEAYNQEPGVIQHIFTAWRPQGGVSCNEASHERRCRG